MAATVTASKFTDTPDAHLVTKTLEGDDAAFDELFRRHAHPAWRMALAVGGSEASAEQAVAEGFTATFRSLHQHTTTTATPFRLLVVKATYDAAVAESRSGVHPVADEAPNGVIEAFRRLPSRWRAILWLTQVEGGSAAQAAPLLGLSAEAAETLATRAENGLRERFLQGARSAAVTDACESAMEQLSDYEQGKLSPEDTAALDRHIGGCETCRTATGYVFDLKSGLRPIVLPLPSGLGTSAAAWWNAWYGASQPTHRRPLGALFPFGGPWLERAVAGAGAAVFSIGVLAALLGDTHPGTSSPLLASPNSQETAGAAPVNTNPATTAVTTSTAGTSGTTGGSTGRRTPSGGSGGGGGGGGGGITSPTTPAPISNPGITQPTTPPTTQPSPSTTTPTPPPPPPPPPPADDLGAGVNVGGVPIGVTVGPGGVGAQIGDVTIGTPPPASSGGQPGVNINIPGLPPIVIPLG